jgi:hypothetical protein
MHGMAENGVSKKVLVNTALLVILVVTALVLFFVYGGRTTPVL